MRKDFFELKGVKAHDFRPKCCIFALQNLKHTMAEEQKNKTQRANRTPQPIDNTYGHLQPQATDVERAVLGALMIDKDAYAVVCELLYPESFYEPRNQKIYAAIRQLSMDEKPVDIMTVADQLAKQGELEAVGGPAYIVEISSRVASSANVEYHARIIAQKFLARQLIQFASDVETAFQNGKPSMQVLDLLGCDHRLSTVEILLYQLSHKVGIGLGFLVQIFIFEGL